MKCEHKRVHAVHVNTIARPAEAGHHGRTLTRSRVGLKPDTTHRHTASRRRFNFPSAPKSKPAEGRSGAHGRRQPANRAPAAAGRIWRQSGRLGHVRPLVVHAGDRPPHQLQLASRRGGRQHRHTGLRRDDLSRPLFAQHGGRRCATAVAVPDAALAAAAAGEDDALLAQLLRHRVLENLRRREGGERHAADGRKSLGRSSSAAGPDRVVP